MNHWIGSGERLIYTVLISAIIYILTSPGVCIYLFFSDIIWLLLLSCYGNKSNRNFLISGLTVSIGCTVSFLFIKLFTGHHIRPLTDMETYLLSMGVIEIIITAILCRNNVNKTRQRPKLYDERKYDLERIKDYIAEFNILGINATWGTGKSFVMDYLKDDPSIQKQFEIIQIDLLTCDLDAVELILLDELEKLFQRHRIYPESSHRLKNLLGKNKWTSMFGEIIGENSAGISASFEGLRREIDKLDKRILIIFEDIDRIFETETIQKIFAISEKFAFF